MGHRGRIGLGVAVALFHSISSAPVSAAQQTSAGDIVPTEADTWDLTELFSSVEEWDAARQEVLASLGDIEARKGTLSESAGSLLATAQLMSDYPYELLKSAGVDMATPDPYQALIRRMNDVMDQMEALLEQG